MKPIVWKQFWFIQKELQNFSNNDWWAWLIKTDKILDIARLEPPLLLLSSPILVRTGLLQDRVEKDWKKNEKNQQLEENPVVTCWTRSKLRLVVFQGLQVRVGLGDRRVECERDARLIVLYNSKRTVPDVGAEAFGRCKFFLEFLALFTEWTGISALAVNFISSWFGLGSLKCWELPSFQTKPLFQLSRHV